MDPNHRRRPFGVAEPARVPITCVMDTWPRYVCAILDDLEGRVLLESRPDDARLAAGKLTCFGGLRESGESPEACLRRELCEELHWEPRTLEKRVELRVAG